MQTGRADTHCTLPPLSGRRFYRAGRLIRAAGNALPSEHVFRMVNVERARVRLPERAEMELYSRQTQERSHRLRREHLRDEFGY